MSVLRNPRVVGFYAVVAGVASVVIAPLLALSYFAIPDGGSELQTATVAAWARPARSLAGGLLTFATPDRVYATYTQLMLLVFPSILVCALLAKAGREPGRGGERWGWRISLAGYTILNVGLLALFTLLFAADPNGSAVNMTFSLLMVPGMLISLIGSTVLGIALLRARYTPRLTAWLLTLSIPCMVVGSAVLGHNSLGLIALTLAWAATGGRLRRAAAVQRSAHTSGAPA